jgi:hypothetical protein
MNATTRIQNKAPKPEDYYLRLGKMTFAASVMEEAMIVFNVALEDSS